MKIKLLISFSFVLYSVLGIDAAGVDTLLVKSPSMKKDVEVIVISPDNPGKCPVVYLLHGYGGNARAWIELKPELRDIADRDGIIFVCPDGKNSWYWDSPKDSLYRYETFISKELVAYIDDRYPTCVSRNARAITGLSMGGHGAIWLSLRHADVFGAAGSTSGGLDIRPFPESWEMNIQLGELRANKTLWDAHAAINQIHRIKNGDLALIIDCGHDDFFFNVNNEFHQKLLSNKIDHDFIVRPGNHTGEYWNSSIDYQILFFKKFFDKAR